MTDGVENLIIEHLRHIRGRVDRIAEDIGDLKQRMSSLETAMVSSNGKGLLVTKPTPGSKHLCNACSTASSASRAGLTSSAADCFRAPVPPSPAR